MKIERVRLERRSIDLGPPFFAAWDPEPRRSFEATIVFVETDAGWNISSTLASVGPRFVTGTISSTVSSKSLPRSRN